MAVQAVSVVEPAPLIEIPPTAVPPAVPVKRAVADQSPPPPDDVVVKAKLPPPPGDPMQGVNKVSFEATQAVDRAFFGPVALGYQKALPKPLRSGIRNLLRNLGEPIVFVNFLLQLKPGKAAETLGRFTINSTLGVAGVIDVARTKPFRLPYRPNGIADTLGYYGVGPGPYLFLPLIGPTTVRDLFGRGVDAAVLPLSVGFPFNDLRYAVPANALRSIDYRAEFNPDYVRIRNDPNPYRARRELYLAYRQVQIDRLRGKQTTLEQLLGVPAAPAPAPVAPPKPEPQSAQQPKP
ncbi:VacJ family lipoprotein [Sphingomonas sp.]|uniref:MlaA family lipoprotein n=1 Tax=Sphingomonas sp. TaxID=28214 RepID=UPI0025D79CFE|nr:VacJ family lipoprotein [Sphingomonas sp.]